MGSVKALTDIHYYPASFRPVILNNFEVCLLKDRA